MAPRAHIRKDGDFMIKYTGNAASGGLAVGKIKVINRRMPGFKRVVLTSHRERALYEAAVILAKDEIRALMDGGDRDRRDILNFQLVMLDDRGMNNMILDGIENGQGAAGAVEAAMEEYCQRLKATGNEYLSRRTGDIRDVLSRVVDILDGRNRERFKLSEPCIVVADEILPSDLASIDRQYALGFVTVGGSYQSHANIMARTMGIPSVCGVDEEVLNPLNNGRTACLDGYAGDVHINPKDSTIAMFNHRIRQEKRVKLSNMAMAEREVFAPDGAKVDIMVNAGTPEDIARAVAGGADGVGLVRSEMLLMTENAPTREEQFKFYADCITAAGGKPITIRTFDIGADKQLPWLELEPEPNPAMGIRGVRLYGRLQQLFDDQIRALYRAADSRGELNIMLPMVRLEREVDEMLSRARQIKDELIARGIIKEDRTHWGIMIETPAAAIISDKLAKKVEFFSIGTNDLTQYTMAADRMNEDAAPYYDYMHPAVLSLMELAVKNAAENGVKVSVCGESAADPVCRRAYIDMGIHCLSMAHGALISVKSRLLAEEQ